MPARQGGTVNEAADDIAISLIRGGSFYWVQEKFRLIRPGAWDLQRRLPFAVAITWLPLLVLAFTYGGLEHLRAVLVDYRVYARVFVAIPLLFVGQITMEVRFREVARHFLDANLVRVQDVSRFAEIMQKARRLRDAKLPEVIAILAVYIEAAYFLESGRLSLASWAVQAGSDTPTPAGYYAVFVGHAMFLGLVTVALWKWAIWVYVLHQISRLNLQLDATNGDRTGGLGFLGDVPRAFSPLVLAISAVIGGTWRAQVLAGQQTLDFLKWPAAFLVVLVLLIFLLPLGLFTPMLVREKREGNLKYGSLRHLHSLQFRRKWLGNRSEHVGELLGNPDVSSLADLSAAFENVDDMIAYPFRRSAVLALLAALALPMLPVVITQIPFKDLIRNLFSAMH